MKRDGALGPSSTACSEAPPTRFLQYTYGGEQVSGIDTYLLETYRTLDKDKIQFDFLFRYEVPFGEKTISELLSAGARVDSLGVREASHPVLRQVQEVAGLWTFFRRRRYQSVEVNMTALFMCLSFLILAWLRGAKVRVVHAHDAVRDERGVKWLLKRAFKPVLDHLATDHWACSEDAAKYLYPQSRVARGEWMLVRNTIDCARFAFDPERRAQVRTELGVEDQLCVGVIGRLTRQKNHEFALTVLSKVLQLRRDVVFVFVGSGPLADRIEKQARLGGVRSHLRLLGARDDIPGLMSAFDVLFAPSLHEGFPIVALEAQAAGLPLIVSDAFPTESNLTGGMTTFSLNDDVATWAVALTSVRVGQRIGGAGAVAQAGYDRASTARQLEYTYLAMVAERAT